MADSTGGAGPLGSGSGEASPPIAGMVNPGAIDVVDLVRQATSKFTGQVQGIGGGGGAGAAAAQGVQGADMIAAGQQRINTANEEALLKLKTDNEAALAEFGFTPGAASGVVAELSGLVKNETLALNQSGAKINRDLNKSFLDNPIDWLISQITLPFDVQAHNAGVANRNEHLMVLRNMAAATDDRIKLNATVDTAAGVARLQGMNEIALGEALLKKSQIGLEVAKVGIQSAQLRLATTHAEFSAVVQEASFIANVANQRTAQGFEQERIDMEKHKQENADESHKIDMAFKTIQVGDAQAAQEAKDYINAKFAVIKSITGLDINNVEQFKLMADGRPKQLIENLLRSSDLANGSLGPNAASALEFANELNLKLTPSMNYVREKLIGWRDSVIGKESYTWRTLEPSVRNEKIQAEIKTQVQSEANNVKPEGGIYSPPPLAAVIQLSPYNQQSKILQELALTAGADPRYRTDANDLLATASKLITSGKATPEAMAQELSEIYKSIITDNNSSRKYSAMMIPMMTGFKTSVYDGLGVLGFGNTTTIDMTSKAAIESMLLRAVTRFNNPTYTPLGVGTP